MGFPVGCFACCHVQVKGTPAAAAIAERRASTSAASATTHSRVRLMAEAVVTQITSVAAAANVADKVVRKYTHALSGFAVSGPTPNQLRALVADPNVAAIWPNRIYRTVSAPGLAWPRVKTVRRCCVR
jgi:3-methyladenine DNA glycosylase/8-oxoguanine DNA glycosylase